MTLNKDVVPNDLQKKVTLLLYFSQYMDEHLIQGVDSPKKLKSTEMMMALEEDIEKLSVCSGLTSTAVFMKKWFRTDRAIVMHLNNGTLQVCLSTWIVMIGCYGWANVGNHVTFGTGVCKSEIRLGCCNCSPQVLLLSFIE